MEILDVLKDTEIRIKKEFGIDVKVIMTPVSTSMKMTPKTMCYVIGLALGLTDEQMVYKYRIQELVIYRQLCAYFIRQYYSYMSLTAIGKLIGKDHTTVMHSIGRVKQFLDAKDAKMLNAYKLAINAIAAREGEEEYY